MWLACGRQADLESRIDGFVKSFEADRAKYEPLVSAGDESRTYRQFMEKLRTYLSLWPMALELSRKNQTDQAGAVVPEKLTPLYREAQKDLDALVASDRWPGTPWCRKTRRRMPPPGA